MQIYSLTAHIDQFHHEIKSLQAFRRIGEVTPLPAGRDSRDIAYEPRYLESDQANVAKQNVGNFEASTSRGGYPK